MVGLPTGDYTIEGFERALVIERKGSSGELAGNFWQPRFWAELERLDKFVHPYLILEFSMDEIVNFPQGSGIPKSRWKRLKMRGPLFLKMYTQMRIKHPKLRVQLAGAHGRAAAINIFKRLGLD